MKIRIDNVRFSQVYVHTQGKPFDATSKEKFSIHGIIEKTHPQLQQIQDAIVAAAKQEWGDKWETKFRAVKAAGKQWVLRDGDIKEDNPAYAGKLFIAAKNEIRPLVIGPEREPLTSAEGKPYPGSYGNLVIDINASDLPASQIYAYLLGVQFIKDGDRLSGGGVAAMEDFQAIPGTAAAGAPSAAAPASAASLF